jgi:hypothetical protein
MRQGIIPAAESPGRPGGKNRHREFHAGRLGQRPMPVMASPLNAQWLHQGAEPHNTIPGRVSP